MRSEITVTVSRQLVAHYDNPADYHSALMRGLRDVVEKVVEHHNILQVTEISASPSGLGTIGAWPLEWEVKVLGIPKTN